MRRSAWPLHTRRRRPADPIAHLGHDVLGDLDLLADRALLQPRLLGGVGDERNRGDGRRGFCVAAPGTAAHIDASRLRVQRLVDLLLPRHPLSALKWRQLLAAQVVVDPDQFLTQEISVVDERPDRLPSKAPASLEPVAPIEQHKVGVHLDGIGQPDLADGFRQCGEFSERPEPLHAHHNLLDVDFA